MTRLIKCVKCNVSKPRYHFVRHNNVYDTCNNCSSNITSDKTSKNQMGAIGGLVGVGVTLLAAKAVIDTTQELATGKKIPKKQKATTYTEKGLNYMLGRSHTVGKKR